MIRLACTYSPTCRADHPDPVAELDWLAGYIQGHPVEGDAYDGNGNLVHVRIGQTALKHTSYRPVTILLQTTHIVRGELRC